MINRRNFLVTLGASTVIPALSGPRSDNSTTSPIPTREGSFEIAVAGDARGNMIGVITIEQGKTGIRDAQVDVAGSTPVSTWRRTTHTGEHGVFLVEIPRGSAGTLTITASKNGLTSTLQVNVRDLSLVLTPKPNIDTKDRLSLDGTWQFAVDRSADILHDLDSTTWHDIKVPSHWEMEGFVCETGRAVYKKTATLPQEWSRKRIKLYAGAVYSSCEIFVNGERVGSHEGGATPFEIDITDAAKTGNENTVVILVQERSKSHEVDMASFFAYFELAGIWQSIEIFATEPAHIARLAYVTSFDDNHKDAFLTVDMDLVNEQSKSASNVDLKLTLLDPKGEIVELRGVVTKTSLGPWEEKKLRFTTKVSSPQQWNAEQPKLYALFAQVSAVGQTTTKVETKIGFRTIAIKGKTLFLNGKPIKLLGVSRLESDPLLGRALTDELNKLDVQLMKMANFNSFRATIFPPHPAALDYSDELGLYVEDEGPATFVSMGTADDLRYAPMYAGHVSEMVERDRNHPSVIYYSICNESVYGRVFQIARDLIKKADPSRPSSATWVTIDPDYSRHGRADDYGADVATLHHPITVTRVKKMANHSKPVLFDEVLTIFHGTEALAPELDIDPGMFDYWITGIPEIVEEIRNTENCLGAMQFAWTDDKFLVPNKGISSTRKSQPAIRYTESVYKVPGRGILGEVAWGTLDGWRRPKPAFWLSKKVYSPIHVEEKVIKPSNPLVVPVKNLSTFINLDQYTCKWEIGNQSGSVKASVPPGESGSITIPIAANPKVEDVLQLEFYEGRDGLVDGYRLQFREHPILAWPNLGRPARIYDKNPAYMDESDPIRLVGSRSELSYDRTNGQLRWALSRGEQVISLGPKLHMLRSDYPTELDYPHDWKFTGESHAIENHQAVIRWNGAFGKDFTGGYEIKMDDAGNAEFHYNFKYVGPDVYAREIGLRFELPLQFDNLAWDRRSEYSYYPPDHIGRPVGKAVAHPSVPQSVPPGNRPYSLDDHPWGCNDFRSTKRNLYQATIQNQAGQGIKLISDGTQHIRAMVGIHDIRINILDFYGGSGPLKNWANVGFHYGPGKLIRSGEAVKGVVRIQLT
jgi:beta-galactosidase